MKRFPLSWMLGLSSFVLLGLAEAGWGQAYELVKTLDTRGERPRSTLVQTDAGDYLGTTLTGGASGSPFPFGTVFKITPTGTYSTLVNFIFPGGIFPSGPLTKGSDGKFYGATFQGGSRGVGTLYRVTAGGTLETMGSFSGTNGGYPQGRLAQGGDGSVFGVGALADHTGVVFKVTPTKLISVVARFGPTTTGKIPDLNALNGSYFPYGPASGLIKASNGSFYGVTPYGGANNAGTAFKVTPGGTLSLLATFGGSNPPQPSGALVQGHDGNFYGTTIFGGTNNLGTVFRLTPAGAVTVLASFDASTGIYPQSELIQDAGDVFYGTTPAAGAHSGGTVYRVVISGDTGTITKMADLDDFNGKQSIAGLAFGDSGSVIGVAEFGGAQSQGTAFKVSSGGVLSKLTDLGSANGSNLETGLTSGPDGNLYGIAGSGGSKGSGTFFRLSTTGDFTLIGSLNSAIANEPLSLGQDGKLYGASDTVGANGYGSLFSATTGGVFASVVDFTAAGGRYPNGVIQASDGAFYGTTQDSGGLGQGTVYRYSTTDGLSVLYDFPTTTGTLSRLVEGPDGALYGTTSVGGPSNAGTVYRVTTTGEFKTIGNFNVLNGANPSGPLVVGFDRKLYGATQHGGQYNLGVIFRITTSGKLAAIASLNGSNGAFPVGGLAVGPGGNLYGLGQAGGGIGKYGTIFKVAPSTGLVTVVKIFSGGAGGSYPRSRIIVGPDQNLYGTTYNTVFRLKTNNVAPVAVNDNLTLPVINANLLRNDTDANKDPLRIVSLTSPAKGSVELNADGTVTYVPSLAFVDTDSFQYTITDPLGATSTATVNVALPANVLTAGLGGYTGVLAIGGNTRGYCGIAVAPLPLGSFTGAVYLDGVRTALLGTFNASGQFSKTVNRPGGLPPLLVTLKLDPGRNQITGTINNGTDSFDLALIRVYPAFSTTRPSPVAGRYTVLLPTATADIGVATVPQGTGYASLTISSLGAVSMVGKLGDGTSFMAGSRVTHDDRFPIYVSLYGTKGYFAGLVDVTAQAATDATGVFRWFKPATGVSYPGGFATNPQFLASRYVATKPVLPLAASTNNAKLVFTNLPLTKTLTVSKGNLVTVTNPAADKATMLINATAGTFSGSYMDGATLRSFAGAIFQKGATPHGEGFYRRATTTDQIVFSAP